MTASASRISLRTCGSLNNVLLVMTHTGISVNLLNSPNYCTNTRIQRRLPDPKCYPVSNKPFFDFLPEFINNILCRNIFTANNHVVSGVFPDLTVWPRECAILFKRNDIDAKRQSKTPRGNRPNRYPMG